jgi:uncharacterized protein
MHITPELFALLFILAFVCELIDSSLGMGYGTILSPVLLIVGFDPVVSVPAVLLSQAGGGSVASVFHHRFKNASFHPKGDDLKVVLILGGFCVAASIIAAIVATKIPKTVLETYISILVLVMGIIILTNKKFPFTWKKIVGVSLLSAFNKGISGGGFGPIVTAGQIMAGQKHKAAVAVTTFAEIPVCVVSFLTYVVARSVTEIKGPIGEMGASGMLSELFSARMFPWELLLALILGSVLSAPLGAFTTKKINEKYIHIVLGVLIIVLSAWTLVKIYAL